MTVSEFYEKYKEFDYASDAVVHFNMMNDVEDNIFSGENLYSQRVFDNFADCSIFYNSVSKYLFEDEFYISGIVNGEIEDVEAREYMTHLENVILNEIGELKIGV